MSVEIKSDWDSSFNDGNAICKTVRADGSSGYAWIKRDDNALNPLTAYSRAGDLCIEEVYSGNKFVNLNAHMTQKLGEAILSNNDLFLEFYKGVSDGKYANLKIGLTAETAITYPSRITNDSEYKFVLYYINRYSHKSGSLCGFNDISELKTLEFADVVFPLSNDELYSFYVRAFPDRLIIPMLEAKEDEYSFPPSVSTVYSECTGYWEFDFESYKDCIEYTVENGREKWEAWVRSYVETRLFEAECYWNNDVYCVKTCNAEDIDSFDMEAYIKMAKEIPGMSFNAFNAYCELISSVSSSHTYMTCYGDAGVKTALTTSGVVKLNVLKMYN